jgi:hypothetical protein
MPYSRCVHATLCFMILLGATKGSYGGSGLCALKYYRSRRRHFCFHLSPSTVPAPRADAVPAFIVGLMDIVALTGRS